MFPIILNISTNLAMVLLIMITYYLKSSYRRFSNDALVNNALEYILQVIDNYNAAHNDKVQKCKELLIKFPNLVNTVIDSDGNTPFLLACKNNLVELLEFMIANGADISTSNNNGEGPFFLLTDYIIRNRHELNVRGLWLLNQAGCDINAKTHEGFTALHLAAAHGYKRVINWLLEKGADPNVMPLPAGIALANGHQFACTLILSSSKKNGETRV